MIWSESIVSLISSHLQDNYHEGTHQEGTIDHFVSWVGRGAIMENPVLGVVLISEEARKLT